MQWRRGEQSGQSVVPEKYFLKCQKTDQKAKMDRSNEQGSPNVQKESPGNGNIRESNPER